MLVEFEKEYLKELYETGKCRDKKHRYQPGVVKGYAKCIYRLQEAQRVEDLYLYHALRFEALAGDKAGLYSVRVNDQYRVEFRISAIGDTNETDITVCSITDLSNHYKK